MAESGRSGMPQPAGGPPPEELEEKWRDVVGVLAERPRDAELLVQAGQLSEQLKRQPEAYTYYRKALTLDPSKSFLVSKLRSLAITPEQKDEVTKISRRPASFTAGLGDIFVYPLRGKGLPVLIMGALLLWLARSLLKYGIGGSGMTIAVVVGAYMAMFYIDVCHTTVGGDDHLPEFPDPLRLNEFAVDVAKFVCATIAAFLPVILILVLFGATVFSSADEDLEPLRAPAVAQPSAPEPAEDDEDEPVRSAPAPVPTAPAAPVQPVEPSLSPVAGAFILSVIGIAVFGLVGLVYLPMATLSNVVMGSPWTCFNFPFVFRSISSTLGNYLICLGCYLGTSVVVGAAEYAVKLADIMLVTGVVLAFLELYGMTVLMRLLGLFYRMNQAKLDWMSD